MAQTNEFWVPNELALEILGFNKNILEKRINADYIKREIRGGIELLEISGEIERFGLSIDVAKEKLDAYVNKSSGDTKRTEIERPKSKTMVFDPAFTKPNEGIPVQPVVLPSSQTTQAQAVPASQPAVKVIDHAPQLNKIAQILDEIRKLTVAMPESIMLKTPKETNTANPQISELKLEVSRLAVLTEQNLGFQKEIANLQAQLKTSNAEVTRLSTQSNAVMDELERTNQKHNKEIETLKNTIKTEIGGINSVLTLKLRKPKGGAFIILLLIFVLGANGFLIFELMQPTYSVLSKPNDKVNPLSKKEVSDAVKNLVDPLEEKLKSNISTLNTQNKESHQKELQEINAMISTSLESQKEQIKKTLETISQNQKDSKASLDENYTKSLKTIESHVADLEKLIKKMLETTVQIKPGTKFMPDSNE